MRTITIKNLSTYTDHSAVARVALYMAGDLYNATRRKSGEEVVKIVKHGNTYTVTDKEDPDEETGYWGQDVFRV